jgi:hypothetical protein
MKKIVFTALFILFTAVVFAFSIRGFMGEPIAQSLSDPTWKDEGALELSPDRSRYALAYSLVENKSPVFTLPIARFITPDLGYLDGKFVSLFAPGVSFLIIPGYVVGKMFGAPQVGAVAIISLFAIFNALCIRGICYRLGIKGVAPTIAALVFLFATPAYTYAVSLYQHHVSTFLLLASIYILIRYNSIWSLSLIWFLAVFSISVDYPNAFLMAPVSIFALSRLFTVREGEQHVHVTFKMLGVVTFVSVLIPLSFFLWSNALSYGNPLQLAGTISSIKALDEAGNPIAPDDIGQDEELEFLTNPESQEKSAVGFFMTRNILNGFNTHFISPDRGMLYYAPVILLGVIGLGILYRKNSTVAALIVACIGANILLYSMWGDPYGGWAFGSRYLIPSYALLSIGIAAFLHRFSKNGFLLLLFLMAVLFSVSVNTAGAITSSRNPPKAEVLNLEKVTGIVQKYTVDRNFDMLRANRSKSFIFNAVGTHHMSAYMYYIYLVGFLWTVAVGLLIFLFIEKKPYDHR